MLRVAAQQVVARGSLYAELLDGFIHLTVQAQRGFFRQVVEQRRGALEKQRQVILDPRWGIATADFLVNARLGRVALEAVAETLAKMRLTLLVQRKLTRGQQADFRHGIQCALGVHVKRGDGFDLVVKQINAVGQHAPHRKQVNDAPPDAEFAGRQHLLDMAVPGESHLFAQARQIQLLAAFEEKSVGSQIFHRRQRVQRGRHRHDQHIAGLAADMVQCGQALGNQILVR